MLRTFPRFAIVYKSQRKLFKYMKLQNIMQKYKRRFVFFIIIWIGVLDYLILTRSTINSPFLSSISEPFTKLFTGSVTGAAIGMNHVFTLIIINVVVALLFYMSYIRWEENKKR